MKPIIQALDKLDKFDFIRLDEMALHVAELNAKVEELRKAGDSQNWFIRFTDRERFGINRPYAYIFRIDLESGAANGIYTQNNIPETLLDALQDEVNSRISKIPAAFKKTTWNRDNWFSKFTNIPRYHSEITHGALTKMMLKVGIQAFYDTGSGVINRAEPAQILVLNQHLCQQVQLTKIQKQVDIEGIIKSLGNGKITLQKITAKKWNTLIDFCNKHSNKDMESKLIKLPIDALSRNETIPDFVWETELVWFWYGVRKQILWRIGNRMLDHSILANSQLLHKITEYLDYDTDTVYRALVNSGIFPNEAVFNMLSNTIITPTTVLINDYCSIISTSKLPGYLLAYIVHNTTKEDAPYALNLWTARYDQYKDADDATLNVMNTLKELNYPTYRALKNNSDSSSNGIHEDDGYW